KGIAPEHFKKLVAVGMTYFGLGHVFYFAAILVSTEIYPLSFLISLAFVAVAFFGLSTKRFANIGKMKYVCLGYYYILATTLLQSLFAAIYSDGIFATIFFIGTCFFFVSDTLLSFMYFGGAKGKAVSIINLSTYYTAQLLIAMSILFI
ncbi:MAG: lysoplasmalogenase family protein, partial [Clostridia bacterium]